MAPVFPPVEYVPVLPPPPELRARRDARFAIAGERRDRYHLPEALQSPSPVGFRTRVAMSGDELRAVLPLLSMQRPTGFAEAQPPSEGELFDEASLGVLSARQSTNYNGHRQVTLGPESTERLTELLRSMPQSRDALRGAAYAHVVFSRPYRTPFTFLLTFIGHAPLASLLTVPIRAFRKRIWHEDDIPTIGYLQHVHLGVLADAAERATVIGSAGRRRADIHLAPFCGQAQADNAATIAQIEALSGLTGADRRQGWRVAMVVLAGTALPHEAIAASPQTWRKLGANLMAFRSERILPGVNHEPKAPAPYQRAQHMDVPDALTVQAGRAAYNAFARWTGCDRERAKELLLLERIDVLTPNGERRLAEVRDTLEDVTLRVMKGIPLWADLPTGKRLSGNASRGRKAFGLAGQRVYIGGLSRREIGQAGLDFSLAVRAFGAAAARSALVAELMGVAELPEDCDLLAGICLMAGPVNQNDIGKSFFGHRDLLDGAFPGRDPTSLLVWTLKAKTVADPIGNEEQLMNPARKGALVDLRPGPADVIRVERKGEGLVAFRGGVSAPERAFGDVGNFVVAPDGAEVPSNRTPAPPRRSEPLW